MLTLLLTVTLCLFGALFPVFLRLVEKVEKEVNIHRFVHGLSVLTSTTGVLLSSGLGIGQVSLGKGIVWVISVLAVTQFYWRKPRVKTLGIIVPSLLGLIFCSELARTLITNSALNLAVLLLGGLILSGSLFAMILGHWYLNVIDLPISLLRSATRSVLVLLSLRAVWDLFSVSTGSVEVAGFEMSLFEFLGTLDGLFLWCAVFFGTIAPLALTLFTLKTIAIHSTQSATGLLYVLVISVLMGDLFYRFYSLQYGLFL